MQDAPSPDFLATQPNGFAEFSRVGEGKREQPTLHASYP